MQKSIVSCIAIFLINFGFAQDLRNKIKSGNVSDLQKLEKKGVNIYQAFSIPYRHAGDEEQSETEMYGITYAAALNKLDIVKYYLAHKNSWIESGEWDDVLGQAFICALASRNDTIIELIYAEKPNLNALCESCRNQNAIMVAAAYGLEKWFFILKEKSDLSLININGASIIHCAVSGGSTPIIGDLVKSNKHNLNLQDMYGSTPLDFAALDSNAEIFSYLLTNGASLDSSSQLWYSAAESGNMEIFNVLVKDYNHALLLDYDTDSYEWPLHYALGFNYTIMATEMIRLMRTFLKETNPNFYSDEPFYYCEVHPLHWTLVWQNSTTFVAVVEFIAFINEIAEDSKYIVLPKYIRKRANKVFGKTFATEVFTRNNIGWE